MPISLSVRCLAANVKKEMERGFNFHQAFHLCYGAPFFPHERKVIKSKVGKVLNEETSQKDLFTHSPIIPRPSVQTQYPD